MTTFEESFSLYLPVISGIVSGVATALFTHWLENRRREREIIMQEFWKQRDIAVENRRKEHEIKVDIVSKMDETIMHQIGKAVFFTSLKKKSLTEEEQKTEFENIHRWYAFEAKRIESKLNTYFPETDLNDRWDTYARTLIEFINALFVYVFESDPDKNNKMIKPPLQKISEYLKSTGNEKYDELIKDITSNFKDELVTDVIAVLSVEGGNIKSDIMKTPIKIFRMV